MDIRNNTNLGTIDSTPVVQFNTIFAGGINGFANVELLEDSAKVELSEANYCPLPAYCLIEDKHLYLAGILK